jgi:N6-L-threonylcarbamoyladenine synthase
MIALGFDTSNYTTSVAAFDGENGENCSRLLDVKPGELGLRQSDALFAHVKRLPELTDRLFRNYKRDEIKVIGVSTRPRDVEGSYMPCFLAGASQAEVLGAVLGVPVCTFSHQQGHIAASLWSSGRMELMNQPHLAWHLSGGTTELLLVTPDGKNISVQKLGGTTDISAGQLIDRTGVLLGLPFPCGKELDRISSESESRDCFHPKVYGCDFSLSGAQNKVEQYYAQTGDVSATARYALLTVCKAIFSATENAKALYPGLATVFSGGVSSNRLLREMLAPFSPVFCPPQYSTDNAMGIAVLAWLQGV